MSSTETTLIESIEFHVPWVHTSVAFSIGVWIAVGVASYLVSRSAAKTPGKFQVVIELALSYVTGLADELIGSRAPRYYPLFFGLFLYILVSNLIGLIPGLLSPTGDANTAFGLALVVFIYYVFEGIKTNGLKYFKQFVGPPMPWYMFPIRLFLIITETITFFIRPFSLGLRLFCNIYSKEIFLLVLANLLIQFVLSPAPIDKILMGPIFFIMRPVILLLGLVISFIQALIFMVLSMSYVAGAVHIEEH
jgi:F-type H+-transporting ATPase subunit a